MVKEFYWDNSATTKPSYEVIQAVMRLLSENYGNPSSLHRKGIEAERVLKDARQIVAKSLKAKEKEIFFTAGGTEANNLALAGLFNGNSRRGKHIVSTMIEHPAVLRTLDHLKANGAEVTLVKPAATGVVEIESILDAIRPDTVIVSIMMVNNETGAKMDVAGLCRAVKSKSQDILFHVDAVQAYGKVPISLTELKIDALSLSGHKLHGPKGIGALFIREGVKCNPIVFGGGQENNLRPGTENMPGIAGLAAAVREAEPVRFMEKAAPFRAAFLTGLKSRGIEFTLNGAYESTVPYIINLSFPGILSEVLLHALESKGVFVSSGSACSSKKKSYSPVLRAMDITEARLESAIRFSFTRADFDEDIGPGLDILAETVKEIGQIMNRRESWKR